MKNKYGNYYDVNDVSVDYGQYINLSDYYKEYYYNWNETKPSRNRKETEDERMAREKAEKRNVKIDQILG